MEFNDLNGEIVLPRCIWSRKLDEEDPDNRIHMYSRPNFFETLILIPLAGRVSLYLFLERYNNREPIFDLRGILLKPPHPGPHAGCPLGGFGSGSIGLNFKGGMVTNRLSIHSGLIQYGSSDINNITIRIQRSDNQQIFIQHFHVENTLGNYHALFPRSWTNYESNVPNVSIIIGRLSPILPHSYSETCFPCGIFDVQVINGNKFDLDVSIMFTLQNMRFPIDGYNDSNRISDNNSEDSNMAANVTYIHKSFEYDHGNITGICLGSEDRRKDNEYNNNGMMDCCYSNSFASPLSANDLMKSNMDNSTSNGTHSMKYHQIQSYSIATQINTIYSDINNACISCSEYVDRDVLDHILTTNGDLSSNSQQSHQQSISTSTRSGNNYYQPSSALCHRIHIPSGTHRSVPFAISWDVPYAKLGTDQLPKYYTRFFGTSGLSAPEIAIYALKYYKGWTSKIELWHQDLQSTNVVEDEREHSIPTYYRYQLFNELYFLVEGSLWLDTCGGVPNTTTTTTTLNEMNGAQDIKLNERLDNRLSSLYIPEQNELHLHDSLCNSSTCGGNQQLVGQFLLIEGFEYLMLNTTDVAFYSSFALIKLWPQLELSIQYDVAQCIGEEDNRMRVTLGEGTSVVRKKKNSVPHDLGSSSDGVFRPGCCNSYCFQDVSRWKDLGPKFILQVYRDFVLTKNDTFLHKMYNRMCEVMEYIAQFDPTGEGMIMNEGFPDQTYDIWTAKGISAYTGGLYVASCQAMTAAATVVGDKKRSIDYNIKAAKARVIYLQTLWNGMYLNYDSSTSEHSTSIMADMCCGHWYSRVCNLPGILPPMVLISCLETIFLHQMRHGVGRRWWCCLGKLHPVVNSLSEMISYLLELPPSSTRSKVLPTVEGRFCPQ